MENNTASFPLFNPSGVRVTFSLAISTPQVGGIGVEINHVIASLLADGFTVNQPGVVEGGDKTDVTAVVRGQGSNREGGTTDRIWMYTPWGDADKGSQITVYLNTPEDTAAFERASGLKVASLPVCKGKSGPTRESGDFERNHRKVQFSIIRAKKDDEGSPVGYKWELVQYVGQPTPPPPPPLSVVPPTPLTPAQSSPASTPTGSGNAGVSADKFAQDFPPSQASVWTPEALWVRTTALFGAYNHFEASINVHAAELEGKTLEEAVAYYQALHWNYDKARGSDLAALANSTFGMSGADVLEALSEANGHKVSKLRDWDGGVFAYAIAALLAFASGYVVEHVRTLGSEKKIALESIDAAITYCQQYEADHAKESA